MSNSTLSDRLPDYKPVSQISVRLLQGALYADDSKHWDLCLRNQSQLESYFGRLGLILVVDPVEGIAFLRQANDEESPPGYDKLPRLFRKSTLTREATLLCVLLRDHLRQFEEEDIDSSACFVEFDELLTRWVSFFPVNTDQVRLKKMLLRQLNKLADFSFVRRSTKQPSLWEIRRLLKVRLPIEELKRLRDQLVESAASKSKEDLSERPTAGTDREETE